MLPWCVKKAAAVWGEGGGKGPRAGQQTYSQVEWKGICLDGGEA